MESIVERTAGLDSRGFPDNAAPLRHHEREMNRRRQPSTAGDPELIYRDHGVHVAYRSSGMVASSISCVITIADG